MYTTCSVPLRGEHKNIGLSRGRSVFSGRSFEEMGRVLSDFFRGVNKYSLWQFSEGESYGSFSPRVEVAEDERYIHVDAEIPGIDEKDIDITLTSDTLTIRGEKKEDLSHKEEEEIHCTERYFGSFSRVISIPKDVDMDKVDASYHNGVLHISLPKIEGGRSFRKVEVRQH
jgi:HSP20 family protein